MSTLDHVYSLLAINLLRFIQFTFSLSLIQRFETVDTFKQAMSNSSWIKFLAL